METEVRASSKSLRSLHEYPSSPILLFLYVFKIHIIKIANYPWLVVFYKLSSNYSDSMVFSKSIQYTCSVLLKYSAVTVYSGKIVKVHILLFIQYTVDF